MASPISSTLAPVNIGIQPMLEVGSGNNPRFAPSAGGSDRSLSGNPGAQILSRPLRSFMEPRFGRDFGHVRLHTDDRAASMSRSLGAKAFTFGHDVFFNRGVFRPDTVSGKRLIAHELSHVVQQSRTGPHVQRQAERESGPACSATRPDRDAYAGELDLHRVRARGLLISRGYSNSAAVLLLQQAIREWGCSRLSRDLLPRFGADGGFGAETSAAVREFQKNHSLQVDGIVGPKTLQAVDEHLDLGFLRDLSPSILKFQEDFGPAVNASGGVPISVDRLGALPSDELVPRDSLGTLLCARRWQPCRAPRPPGTHGSKHSYFCPYIVGGIVTPFGVTARSFLTIPDEFVGTSPRGLDDFKCRSTADVTAKLTAVDSAATTLTRLVVFPNQSACHGGFRANLLALSEGAFLPSGGGRPAGIRLNIAAPGFSGRAFPCP